MTKEEKTNSLIAKVTAKPENYPICLHMECTWRQRCLHALATTEERIQQPYITCVNPREYADGRVCKQLRDKDAKCIYALGMTRIVAVMKVHRLYAAFKERCIERFKHTPYYERVEAQRLILPDEQQAIIRMAADLGVQLPSNAFDQMIETTAWTS